MCKACYVHVPFCASICGYCDFQRAGYSDVLCTRWLDALAEEIRARQIPIDLKTMYLGGGTPSCLSASNLKCLLELLKPYVSKIEEFTMEMNPESCSDEIVSLAASYGVNRVSLGVQSFDEYLLNMMNRHHDIQTICSAIECLHRHGIHNISVDLMYSLPDQSMQMWMDSLKQAVQLNITHISMYSLTIEQGSAFARKGLEPLDADTEADMYEAAIEYLEAHGFKQYEISSFCKEGYESRHNLAYWHYDDFIGLGLGASGKQNHKRYDHPYGFQNYLSDPLKLNLIDLSVEDEMFEMLMMGLRMKTGMSLPLFTQRFSVSFEEIYAEPLKKCFEKKWLMICDDKIKATERGFEILNTVLEEFLS